MIYYRTDSYVIKAALDKSDGIMVALSVPLPAAKVLALEDGQPPSDLHLTLAYLGKRDEFTSEQFQTLHDIIGSIARETAPFDVVLKGYDVFPETDDGPCLYAVVDKNTALDSLQETVVEAVSSYGMPPKGRGAVNGKWVPHITLAYGQSAPPPETPPAQGFRAEWLRVTLGGTEALMRLQRVEKDAMTTGNSPAGILAPGQGMFRKPRPMMKHLQGEHDQSTHGHGGGGGVGGYSVTGTPGKSAVYLPKDALVESKPWGGGESQWILRNPETGNPGGVLLTRPLKDEEIPETLYHTTSNLAGVKGSSHLVGQSDGGGMGGGNNMAGVSFTTSKADAELMQKEMRRMVEITKDPPQSVDEAKAILETWTRQDEKQGGLAHGQLDDATGGALQGWEVNSHSSLREWNGNDWETSPEKTGEARERSLRGLAKDMFTAYLMSRDIRSRSLVNNPKDFETNDKYAMLKNPLFFGDATQFSKMDPKNIGIVEMSKNNLPKEALIRAGSDDFLHEIRVHADVSLKDAKFGAEKDGEAGSGLTTPTDGGEINPIHPNAKKPKRTDEGTEAYTTGNEMYTPTPGYAFKAVADTGKAVAIDFDGTITLDDSMTENPRMRQLVDVLLNNKVRVVIFTARLGAEVYAWLREHNWPALEVTNIKSPDFGVYLDDRAVNFAPGMAGKGLADKLAGFKTWWEKSCNPVPGKPGMKYDDARDVACSHDAGVQPEAHDRLAKLPAVAITNAEWNEADHPRVPGGTAAGGQFSGGGGGGGAAKTPEPGDEPSPQKPKPEGGEADARELEELQRRRRAIAEWNKQHPDDPRPMPDLGDANKPMPDLGKPDNIKDILSYGDLDDDQRRKGKQFFVGDWINSHDPKIPTQEAKDRAIAEWDDLSRDDKLAWAKGAADAQARIDERNMGKLPAVEPEGGTPKPAQVGDTLPGGGKVQPGDLEEPAEEPTPTPTPDQEEWEDDPTPEPVTPESWDELGGDQQEAAKEKWIEAARSGYIQGEIDNWREDDSNFENIPEELSNDAEWNEQALKDANNGYYPGDPVEGLDDSGGGTQEQHAEQERRIAEWRDSFAMDESYKNGAFVVDNVTGQLEVDTDKLVFRDNPHEGPEAERQQLIPGIDRATMANAWKKAKWAQAKSDFEDMYKEAFEKEAEERVDAAKENPPDWIAENADESLAEFWSMKDDKDKFREAQRLLSNLGEVGDSPSAEGRAGKIEPSEEDTAEQKKIQKKKVTASKNLNGGISTTKIITMNDKSKYVWKPSTGEVGAGNLMPAGTQYAREVAAYDIGSIVGMKDMFPTTSIIHHEGQWGAALALIPNSHNDGTSGNKRFENDAMRGTFFDYVIGNVDRHENNWMSDSDGKLWLIDHGRSLPDKDYNPGQSGLNMMSREVLDAPIPEAIKKPWKGKWDNIEKIMQRRKMTNASIASLKKRYDAAMADGVTWRDL